MSAILRALTAVKKATSASFGTLDADLILHLLSALDSNFRNRLLKHWMQKSSCLCLSGCLFVELERRVKWQNQRGSMSCLRYGFQKRGSSCERQSQACLRTVHAKLCTSFILMLLQIWILLTSTKLVVGHSWAVGLVTQKKSSTNSPLMRATAAEILAKTKWRKIPRIEGPNHAWWIWDVDALHKCLLLHFEPFLQNAPVESNCSTYPNRVPFMPFGLKQHFQRTLDSMTSSPDATDSPVASSPSKHRNMESELI